MKPHIKLLLELESRRDDGFIFGRTNDNTIFISTLGYGVQSHNDAELKLLKLKCEYNFEKGIQKFDTISGRSYTYFNEPKLKRGEK